LPHFTPSPNYLSTRSGSRLNAAHLRALFPCLPRRKLIRQPRHHRDRHANPEQQKHNQRANQRKFALLAQALECRVAEVARDVRGLRTRLAVLVSAGPRLDGVELGGVAVEDVCPDDGHEGEEEGGQDSAEGEEGTECVLLAEGELGGY
jgi:hypothetical protein